MATLAMMPGAAPHPLRNRVGPDGAISAVRHRGTMLGIRGGCFHRDDGTLKAREWASLRWIVCELAFKARRRPMLMPGKYTALFFLDEAVAFAGGHRPCFECRRAAAERYQSLWPCAAAGAGPPTVDAMDRYLHAHRLLAADARPRVHVGDLPDGAMVGFDAHFWLVRNRRVRQWSHKGYGAACDAPREPVALLTPRLTVEILARGYQPRLHPSAAG